MFSQSTIPFLGGEKSVFTAYFLWFFFGWLGLHHFYLGRDRQAFIWWSTLGGHFGLGWVRDMWRIPDYVDEANGEPYFLHELRSKLQRRKTPQFSCSRFSGEMLTGYFYGMLVRMAIPEEIPGYFNGILVSLGIAVGVHLVGNIGREKGPFKTPYMVTLCTWYLLWLFAGAEESVTYGTLFCTISFNYYNEYDISYPEESFFRRLGWFCKGALIFWMLWGSFFYFNSTVTLPSTNEKIKLRDAVGHFFNSPAWTKFKETVWKLYEKRKASGWGNFYDDIVVSLDPTGERHALEVLGVDEGSSHEDIRKAYKQLLVKWHPDKYKGPDKKSAEDQFLEIQKAYELLSDRTKRKKGGWGDKSDL